MRPIAIVSTALMAALVLAPATGAWAQHTVNGRLVYIEPGSRTLYFQDGRIVTLEPGATLWVDGRQLAIETVRRGMNVEVRGAPGGTGAAATVTGTQTGSAPAAIQGHPRVTASGTVARVDAERGMVTFQDGRTLTLGRGGQVWEASSLNDIDAGELVLLRDAQPAAFRGMSSNVPADRMRMGRVVQVDPAQSMVLLDDGGWVRVVPTTRMRLNGQGTQQMQLQPGDELIVVISEVQPRSQAQARASREGDQAGSSAPSAMVREGIIERFDAVQADEVHIFRRHQSP